MKAIEVYQGSNGDVTRAYYAELEQRGPMGVIAMNLFRAHKCSARAKGYHLRSHKRDAYDRKQYSICMLYQALEQHAATRGIRWGWKQDLKTPGYEWVLYVELPHGQVSFHSPNRGSGPDYAGEWCGDHRSAERILAFCDNVMGEQPSAISTQPASGSPSAEIKTRHAYALTRDGAEYLGSYTGPDFVGLERREDIQDRNRECLDSEREFLIETAPLQYGPIHGELCVRMPDEPVDTCAEMAFRELDRRNGLEGEQALLFPDVRKDGE